jgi:hypothetical protein
MFVEDFFVAGIVLDADDSKRMTFLLLKSL